MYSRPNEMQELQKLYDMYICSDCDKDDDAYEDCRPKKVNSIIVSNKREYCFGNPTKDVRRNRRRAEALAKERFFKTTDIANKNSRARLSHANRHLKAPIPKYQVAKRLLTTAQKMGFNTI